MMTKRQYLLLLLALCGVLMPERARAQAVPDTAAPSASDEPITVLGTPLREPPGTPAYGSVLITRERLTGDASGRIETLLADVAGFQQFRRADSRSSNPSAQGVTLRALGGNASSRALVLVDGVPVADPFFGSVPFNALVPDQLSAVRVTRGGGAGAFGAGAVAGTIELTSATRFELDRIAGSIAAGSFASQNLTASFAPNLGAGFVVISGRFQRSDGFQTTPRNQRVAATAPARFQDWSGSIRAVIPLSEVTEVQAKLISFADDRTLRFTGADNRSQGQDASLRLIHRGSWQVDALLYGQLRDFSNKVISATSFRLTLDQRATPSSGIGGKLEIRPPIGNNHLLRIGVDTRLADGIMAEDSYSTTTGNITARRTAGGAAMMTGFFVEDDWTIGQLILTGGVRLDRWTISDGHFREINAAGMTTSDRRFADRDGTELTGRIGALWRASSGVTLRAASYTGYRLPTLNELYRPFTVFPVITQANEALAPERLAGFEAGVDLVPASGIAFGLTAFHNRLAGAIANVTIGRNLRQRRNLDAIVATGIELTANAKRGAFNLSGSFAFTNSRVRSPGALDGLIPAQSPRVSGSATLGWNGRRLGLSTTVRYVGHQFEDDLQIDALPPATVVDAVVSVPVRKGFSIIARVENMFDETVITRNAAGSIDLGTPRIFWMGIRLGR